MQDIRQDDREKWFLGATAAELNNFLDKYASDYIIRYPSRVFSFTDADLEIPSVFMKGSGKPRDAYNPTTGTVIKMGSGKRVIADTNATIKLSDLGIWVNGDYSANVDSPIDLFDNNVLNAERCSFYLNMTLANGNAATPLNALGGIAFMLGKSAGPSGVPSLLRDCLLCDHRQGSPSNTYMFGAIVEQLIMQSCFGYERFADALVTPRRFYINPITCATFIGNSTFKDAGVAAVYDVEYLCTGDPKNLHFINNQFAPAARITTANFKTSGTLKITGENPFAIEGGNVPIVLSQSGTVTQRWSGRGYRNFGSSTGTGAQQTIAHDLVSTPTKVSVWNIENGANPYQSAVADATNIYVLAALNQDWGWEAEV